MLTRRAMFGSLVALAAPAIIRTPGLLMPIRPAGPRISPETLLEIDKELNEVWDNYKI